MSMMVDADLANLGTLCKFSRIVRDSNTHLIHTICCDDYACAIYDSTSRTRARLLSKCKWTSRDRSGFMVASGKTQLAVTPL